MHALIRYVILTASRDWLFIGLFAVALSAMALSIFLGGTALSEEQATTLSYMAGSLRLVVVVGLILFVCFHVRRAFDHKEIEFILSRPVSRNHFVLAYWLGFVCVSLLIFIPLFSAILVFAYLQPQPPALISLIYWGLSTWMEVVLMLAFSLVASLILHSAVSAVMASYAFYILARMMGFFIFANQSLSLWGTDAGGLVMKYIIYGVSIILPRLDLFSKTDWLLYGAKNVSADWATQGIIYILLLLAASMTDFRRKQF
jgi:ABC-type transport system involved in multi-copper enzyme maturation permease subunit